LVGRVPRLGIGVGVEVSGTTLQARRSACTRRTSAVANVNPMAAAMYLMEFSLVWVHQPMRPSLIARVRSCAYQGVPAPRASPLMPVVVAAYVMVGGSFAPPLAETTR
jgi:hypothetical protein